MEGFIEGLPIQGVVKLLPLGRLRATTVDGQVWMRDLKGPWKAVQKPPSPTQQEGDEDPRLVLVMQRQATNEPDQWSLMVAKEGQRGDVYQVKGKKVIVDLLV